MSFTAFETDQIIFSLQIKVTDPQDIPQLASKVDWITRTILESPWEGNRPLRDCLIPGQHYDWGFNLSDQHWIDWEFILKPTIQKKECVKVLKQAIQGFLELNNPK